MLTILTNYVTTADETDDAAVRYPIMSAAATIAAILLPPLGVFLVRGMARDFWIAMVLTFFFYLPGAAFALFIVLGGSTDRVVERISTFRRAARA